MAINIYYNSGSKLLERNAGSGSKILQVIDSPNNAIFYFDSSGTFSSASFNVDSASYALSASYAPGNPSISASYALTASYSSNGGSGGSPLTSGSTYNITASWANKVISSSYSQTASYAANGGSGGTTLVTGSTYNITSSWANNVISASYAPGNPSISSSYSTTASYAITAGIFDVTRSVIVSNTASNFVLLTKSTGSILTSVYNYYVKSGSNARAGNINTAWVNSSIVFSDNSTSDIGDTGDLTMSVILNNSNVQLIAKSAATNNWSVTAQGNYF